MLSFHVFEPSHKPGHSAAMQPRSASMPGGNWNTEFLLHLEQYLTTDSNTVNMSVCDSNTVNMWASCM